MNDNKVKRMEFFIKKTLNGVYGWELSDCELVSTGTWLAVYIAGAAFELFMFKDIWDELSIFDYTPFTNDLLRFKKSNVLPTITLDACYSQDKKFHLLLKCTFEEENQ